MVRRHLHMSRTEWQALPWDEQTELYEGLLHEFGKDKGQPQGDPDAEYIEQGEVVGENGEVDGDTVPYSGGEDSAASLDDLAGFGFAVREV